MGIADGREPALPERGRRAPDGARCLPGPRRALARQSRSRWAPATRSFRIASSIPSGYC